MKDFENVKEKIIELISENKTTREIRKIIGCKYTTQQIAAVRAWVTMGKYGKIRNTTFKTKKVKTELIKIRTKIDKLLNSI